MNPARALSPTKATLRINRLEPESGVATGGGGGPIKDPRRVVMISMVLTVVEGFRGF